ncbi:MAG: tRNA (adenosine(37)-N6)-threonylcarbamoyltransferase complex dimerization subunit type 1 TsaB [Tetragenococcus sp.]|nr:tRNA (adenosine(37)-N6)-threonylcarbamoyltransferase complex dimerization subunit type 1 TsaB [Tetragenococcus sp.]
MKVLAIDTSNQTMAVALTEDQTVLGQIQTTINKTHSKTLMPAIDYLMKSLGLRPVDLDRIAVAQGPGSYTGLRIGVTTAKTLADTLATELVGVSSLKTVAANCIGEKDWIVPLFDARRKNVYAGVYQWQNHVLVNVLADQHLSLEELLNYLKDQPCCFVGADVKNYQTMITDKLPLAKINAVAQWDYPNGVVLSQLAQQEEPVADIHQFLPNYLKRVEAEEKWLQTHQDGVEDYVEKI